MSYCINPHCPKPIDLANANNPICRNCGSQLLLQNRYRVLKQLGQGGFGNTFEIDDGGETKVLKVLTENNSKTVELFQQEAKVLSQLNSVGIPKVEADGYFTVLPKNSSVPLHCLVMEKIAGVNLEQWMEFRKYQPIAEKEALNWLKQIVEILALVHAQKYFHRDIKPQNIMLRPSGQLVLIDFGAVRQITTTILARNSHTRIISQGYSPPEQQNGYSVQQSDFFALGRTFIFLLTGKEPQDKAIYDPLTNELHWRKYAVNISPLLADLIDNLIAPKANQRPENTRVILQKLKKIEKALNQPQNFGNTTNIQSKNSSLPTVSVSPGKPVQPAAKPSHKNRQTWKWLIGLSVGYFAVAALNQPNNNNKIPVLNPSISAALKAEQKRKATILKEKAARELQEKQESERREKEIRAAIWAQQRKQAILLEKQRQQVVMQTEKAKQALQTKQLTINEAIPKQQQLPEVGWKKLENVPSSNNYVIDVTKPWEVTPSIVGNVQNSSDLLLTPKRSNLQININMNILAYVANSCQNHKNDSSSIASCIKSRYHYSLALAQFSWLSSTGEIMPRYPAAVVVSKLAYDSADEDMLLLECLVSQDASGKECSRVSRYLVPTEYVVDVCFLCQKSGSPTEILKAFIQWFLRLDEPQKRELISLLGDEDKARQLRIAIRGESLAAVNEYVDMQ
jgi:serine/threonine protein kinase